jgi:N-acetylmuramoyl-L-alanine amidase
MIRALLLLAALLLGPVAAPAQELSALAKFHAPNSAIQADGQGITLTLALSQPVPWRVRLRDNPPRLILDVREVDWSGIDTLALPKGTTLRAGVFRPGWSRLVMELPGPLLVTSAAMETETGTRLRLSLSPATAQDFAVSASQPEPPDWALPRAADLPPVPKAGSGPLVVVLDPGHGGIDPGAERDGEQEKDLVLLFARELKELLLRDGRFGVVMTREDDTFVPLETRISLARAAGAGLFISLHADAVAEGEAVGATVYTLSDAATDEASATLAERHDRDDLLAGVDLSDQDDLVAQVLMDMARTETTPRTDRLADALVGAMKKADIRMHRHPRQEAGFSVLKSPDIPSVLVELGFLSSARDLRRLTDPAWRSRMAGAIRDGLVTWAAEDRAIQAKAP